MTPLDYIGYFFWGLSGIIFMILIKLKALKTRTQVANETFSVLSYFKDDYLTILLSLLTLIIALGIVKSAVTYKPQLESWMNGIFVGVGYMGTSLLSAFLSKAEVRINTIVDQKTNIADNINPGQSQ